MGRAFSLETAYVQRAPNHRALIILMPMALLHLLNRRRFEQNQHHWWPEVRPDSPVFNHAAFALRGICRLRSMRLRSLLARKLRGGGVIPEGFAPFHKRSEHTSGRADGLGSSDVKAHLSATPHAT